MERDLAWARRGELRGRGLRHLLVVILADAARPLDLHELVEQVASRGVRLRPDSRKHVADALCWEIRRVRRGVFEFVEVPPSTMRWTRRRVDLLLGLVAESRRVD